MSVPATAGRGQAPAARRRRYDSLIRLSLEMRRYWGYLALTIALGIAHQAAALGSGATAAYVAGAAATGASLERVRPLLWVLGGLVLARGVLAWAEQWWVHDLAYRILADLRSGLYWALERVAPAYLLQRRSGDLAAAAMHDVENLEWFYAHTVGAMAVAVLAPSGALAFLASLHPLLACVLLPAVAGVASVPFWLGRRAAAQGKALQAQMAELNALVVDSVQGLREIVSFGYGPRRLEELDRSSKRLVAAQLAYGRRVGAEKAATDMCTAAGMTAVLVAAAVLVSRGQLAPAWFPVAVVLAWGTFSPIVSVSHVAGRLGMLAASADRLLAILDEQPAVVDLVDSPPPGPVEPRIRFDRVTFRYGSALPPAVENLSFTIEPGETVALVGPSGAGKSTCASLLLRFWDVTEGSITIGGHDLRSFPQEALRQLIAVVPQDIYLFNTSVRENIRLARPEATNADVERAARLALAHDFIVALPEGYETVVGERGAQLSGGQRQRIAIARAFLKDAPILVMDEAASDLDPENERLLREAMDRVRRGRTTLLIAHRLSTILSADRILVLDRGRLVESGTHKELLQAGGVYARLVEAHLEQARPP